MARKGKSTEEIIAFLREAEVRLTQGETARKGPAGLGPPLRSFQVSWRTMERNLPITVDPNHTRRRGSYFPGAVLRTWASMAHCIFTPPCSRNFRSDMLSLSPFVAPVR
jgi:hypothetical protein